MKRFLTILLLAAGLLTSPAAGAITEGFYENLMKSRSFPGALGNAFLLVAFGPVSDLVSGPVYGYDGSKHYIGLEKEIEIHLGRSTTQGLVKTSHLLFFTPTILIKLPEGGLGIAKLRMGYHHETLLGCYSGFGHRDRGCFGMSYGIGFSLGHKSMGQGFLFAGGPDFKFFYHVLAYTRLVLGVRYEYGLHGHELNCTAGAALAF